MKYYCIGVKKITYIHSWFRLVSAVSMRMWNQSIKKILYIFPDQWEAVMRSAWPIRSQDRVSLWSIRRAGRDVCIWIVVGTGIISRVRVSQQQFDHRTTATIRISAPRAEHKNEKQNPRSGLLVGRLASPLNVSSKISCKESQESNKNLIGSIPPSEDCFSVDVISRDMVMGVRQWIINDKETRCFVLISVTLSLKLALNKGFVVDI